MGTTSAYKIISKVALAAVLFFASTCCFFSPTSCSYASNYVTTINGITYWITEERDLYNELGESLYGKVTCCENEKNNATEYNKKAFMTFAFTPALTPPLAVVIGIEDSALSDKGGLFIPRTIPDKNNENNSVEVCAIDEGAFKDNLSIEILYLSGSMYIQKDAFNGAANLKEIILGGNLYLDSYSLANTPLLTSISDMLNVMYDINIVIESNAFYGSGISEITAIRLSGSTLHAHSNAFSGIKVQSLNIFSRNAYIREGSFSDAAIDNLAIDARTIYVWPNAFYSSTIGTLLIGR